MICPINETCKHLEKDVTVLMCNACMANKLNKVKEDLNTLIERRMVARRVIETTAFNPNTWSGSTSTSSSLSNRWDELSRVLL